MMARQHEERFQDVGMILEDLASYEPRSLLNSSPSGTFVAVSVESQAYQPAREEYSA